MVVDSSLWQEPDVVIKVYLTLIALKDEDHVYRGTAFALGDRAKKSELEVLEALRVLSSPDRRRIEPQEFDGRRIKAVEDGWLVLNGPKYRDMVQKEMQRARNRRAQKAYRERLKMGKPLPGESEYVKTRENGGTDEQAMRAAGQ